MIETLLLVLLFGLLIGGIIIFNRLVKARNRVKAAWSDIDVQLQRRHDLIPRLVEAVKAYAGYEKATLTAVTELRAQSERAPHLAEKARIEQEIETGLHRLIAVAEAYPDLKANQNFLESQLFLSRHGPVLQLPAVVAPNKLIVRVTSGAHGGIAIMLPSVLLFEDDETLTG